MLFEEAAREYMDDKGRRLRACTLAGYESALALHVLPRWGGVELEAIAPEDVQAWVDGFELPGAAEKAYKTLRQVVRWAIRRLGVRMYDPTAAGVELPRKATRRPRTMEAGQVREYLRALWGHECEAVAICSVAPKTERSARSCWLPRFAVRRLRALRKGRSGWLCELSPDAIARRIRSACRRAGAAWTSMTECRHTWATLAVEAGVGIETVALMLGHTDISTAYEHYIVPRARVCKDAQREVERLIMRA